MKWHVAVHFQCMITKQTSCVQSIDIQLQLQFTYALHDETYLLTSNMAQNI